MKHQILIRSFLALVAGAAITAGAQPQTAQPTPGEKQAERNVQAIVDAMKASEKAVIDHAAPDFTLIDTAGKEHRLSDYVASGKTVVLEWFNPQCPVVQTFYDGEGTGLSTTIEKGLAEQPVVWLRINSGSDESRTSGKEANEEACKSWHIANPVLLDPEGKVGMAYGAKVTPAMYVISNEGLLRYEGAIKADRPASEEKEEIWVRDAVQSVLAGETLKTRQTRAYGCGIKYAGKGRGRG